MKALVRCLVFAFLPSFLSAAYVTPNSGVDWTMNDLVLNSNGAVTGAHPNYNVLDSVIIAPNDRLTIAPGSVLVFAPTALVVRGKLLAIGTPSARIVFTGATQTPASWRNIRIEDSAIDTACVFRHCVIEYSTGGIACIGSSPTIEFSTLRFNGSLTTAGGSFAIQCFNSNALIRHDSIYNNSQIAINISNNSSPIVERNYIANNNVRNQSPANPITISFQGNNNPIIRFNEIHSADLPSPVRAGGISVGLGSNSTVQNPLIEFNYIHDCAFGIVIAGATQCVVRNNRIENNARNPNPLQAGSGINVNSSGSAVAAPIITGNFIKGNLWGVTIQGTAQPNLGDLSNSNPDDDGRNTFIDNLQGSTNYALYNNTSNTIRAQNNFWGTTDLAQIQQRIWGQGDAQNPATVIYLPFALGDVSLPVELIEFAARKTDGGVLLSWKTASERGNSGFEVQRRAQNRDARSDDWQTLGFVRGNGASVEARSYSFLDRTASGRVQYRLKQIDFDGRFEYSDAIDIDAGLPQRFSLEQNYPNPFNPTTTIGYVLPLASDVRLEIFDALGRKVATLVEARQDAGSYSFSLDASRYGLSSGVYFYRLRAKDFSETKKLILAK
ncbi:MAG: right-handed parallel beta-helix repeat-containing protein [Chloroherpetonaceae bacterium]|nr:right-handed parallel beta-helix repeat-containing protein [Chloroherpetonaceae bacterium]MDW8437284.1 right-handed parallel beta-helix repeat-containing protein [Chloroherpetonaceae bacterium]